MTEAPAAPAVPLSRNAELEAKVAAAPDDDAAWAVYGDWLQAQGDPRGELIALMRQKFAAAAGAHVKHHLDSLLPGLRNASVYARGEQAPHSLPRPTAVGPFQFHRERVDPSGPPVLVRELEWRHGHLYRASLDLPETGVADFFRAFLSLPIARFLRVLGVGIGMPMDQGRLQAALPVLIALLPSTVEQLVVSDFVAPEESEWSWAELGDVGALWNLKTVRSLAIRGLAESLGDVRPEHLTAFAFETSGLQQQHVKALLAAQWPLLQRFDLWAGDDNYGCDVELEHLLPLLESSHFPKLRRLGLQNNGFTDGLVHALAVSPLLKQLTALDLSKGTLGEDGAAALVQHAEAFAHLAVLHLEDNCLAPEHCAAVKAALPMATGLETQPKQGNPDDRFVSVAE